MMIDKFWEYDSHTWLRQSDLWTPFHLDGDWGGGREEFVLHALPRTTLCGKKGVSPAALL